MLLLSRLHAGKRRSRGFGSQEHHPSPPSNEHLQIGFHENDLYLDYLPVKLLLNGGKYCFMAQNKAERLWMKNAKLKLLISGLKYQFLFVCKVKNCWGGGISHKNSFFFLPENHTYYDLTINRSIKIFLSYP